MNLSRKSKSKYHSLQENKRVKNDTDKPMTAYNKRVKNENGDTPQSSQEVRISGHSTPFKGKHVKTDVEDSPEIDYNYSPILISLTQDGNEVAWDWQGTSDTKECRNVDQNNTPKRKKLVNKRSSNSPLLYKPLKRKLVKMENMESIGKFAAELQALTEQMRNIKRSDEKQESEENSGEHIPVAIQLEIDTKEDAWEQIKQETNEVVHGDHGDGAVDNASIKISTSIEDLFDDSINDSMIRCSQEVEEKFNLSKSKERVSKTNLSTVSEERELSAIDEKSTRYVTARNSSTDSSKTSLVSDNSFTFNSSSVSKTYSKSSVNIDLSSSLEGSKSKRYIPTESSLNNNDFQVNSCVKKSASSVATTDTFEIPDDSFDDCLATVPSDESVLSKSVEYDNIFPSTDLDTKACGKSYKACSSASIKEKKTKSNFIPKTSVLADRSKANGCQSNPTKPANKATCSSNNIHNIAHSKSNERVSNPEVSANTNNRKFFKTKSLSDSCFGHGRNSIVNSKVNTNVNTDTAKCNAITLGSSANTNALRSMVCADKNFTSVNGTSNAPVTNVNRSAVREETQHFPRYKSLGNLSSSVKDAKGSQPAACTPEEIERKRLEAKIRLEAKRKSQMSTRPVNERDLAVQRPVKR